MRFKTCFIFLLNSGNDIEWIYEFIYKQLKALSLFPVNQTIFLCIYLIAPALDFFFFNSCSTFSSIKKCEAITVWKRASHITESQFLWKETTFILFFDVLTDLITINVRISDVFILGMFGLTLACGCGTVRGVSLLPVYHIFYVNVKQFT